MLSHSNSLKYELPKKGEENGLEINNSNLIPLFEYNNLTSNYKNQYNISNEFLSNVSINFSLSVINTYNEPTDTHKFNKKNYSKIHLNNFQFKTS
jgi:hypothetical protein